MARRPSSYKPNPPTFTAEESHKIIGCSYRSLTTWCRAGVFGPGFQNVGSGNFHTFTASDIKRAKVVNRVSVMIGNLSGSLTSRPGYKLLEEVNSFLLENPRAKEMFITVNILGKPLVRLVPSIGEDYLRIRLDN